MIKQFTQKMLTISLSRLLALSLGFIDIVMLGRQGYQSTEIYTIASQSIHIFVILCINLQLGIFILVDKKSIDLKHHVQNIVHYAMSLGVVLSLLSLLGMFFIHDAAVMVSYLLLAMSLLPLALYICFINILETIGLEKTVFYLVLLSAMANFVANDFLIHHMDESAIAVSLSTLLIRCFIMVPVIYLIKQQNFNIKPIYSQQMNTLLFQNGMSTAITSIFFTGGIALLVGLVAQLNRHELTAYLGFLLNYMNTFSIIFVGITTSLTISCSEMQKNPSQCLSLIKFAVIMVMFYSLGMFFLSAYVSVIYTNDFDFRLNEYLKLSTFVMALDGLSMIFIAYLIVFGHKRMPPLFRLLFVFIGVPFPFIITFEQDMILNILFFMAIGHCMSLVLSFVCFFFKRQQAIKHPTALAQ